ncbi:MAG: rare lipoprotein [Chloroflexota bacterium]|jgi:hypothetical protein|nr:rare lipoprotein [Chloroflexota bacterium]
MVGALILEPGISARTQDQLINPDAAASLEDVAGVTLPDSGRGDELARLPGGHASPAAGGHTPRAPGGHSLEAGAGPSQEAVSLALAAVAGTRVAFIIPTDPPLTGEPIGPFFSAAKPAAGTPTPQPKPRPKPVPAKPAPAPAPPVVWNVAPVVTWYGPGFYGHRTACGQRYTPDIIGVAHKTLPCGTLIKFSWHGITAVAPVIDRGPYASSDYVFDFSARLACQIFRPAGVANACFTRHNVAWRIVGRRQS